MIIIGGGPAGYTAAIYAARAGLEPLVIEGPRPGGQLTITTDVENYPGFLEITGPELVQRMREQAAHNGARFMTDTVQRVEFGSHTHKVETVSEQLAAHSIIIATGANAKWLGIPGEQEYMGKGVSACATCDGPMLSRMLGPDARIAVIGGGDTACEEALYLAGLPGFGLVYLVVRRGEMRASRIMQQRVMNHPKIHMIWNRVPLRFEGHETLEYLAITVPDCPGGPGLGERLHIKAAFVAIGHEPATAFLRDQVILENGYIITGHHGQVARHQGTFSNPDGPFIPGVFAAGDCVDHEFRQAVTAAGMGCKAAMLAERYLSAMDPFPLTTT